MLSINTNNGTTINGIPTNGSELGLVVARVRRMDSVRLHLGKPHDLRCTSRKPDAADFEAADGSTAADGAAVARSAAAAARDQRRWQSMSGRPSPVGMPAAYPADVEPPARVWATLVISRAISL